LKPLKVLLVFLLIVVKPISASELTHPKNNNQNVERSSHYSIGMGVSMMTLDDYIGADESQFYIIPTPYIYYESDTVVIDRNAFEGNLFNNKNWHLAVDAAGSIPVDSEKNKAREGMSDLNWVGELGPSLEYYFSGNSRSQNRTYLDVAVRKAINTDFKKISDTGWTGQISLNNKYQFKSNVFGGKTTLDSAAALLFHSDKYSQYFYSVSADEVNKNRAEYSAKGGYAGARLSLGGTWRNGNIWIGLFSRYTYLNNTSFENSPLIRSSSNLLIGLSVSYIFIEK